MSNQLLSWTMGFFKRQKILQVCFKKKNYKDQIQDWLYLQGRIAYLSLKSNIFYNFKTLYFFKLSTCTMIHIFVCNESKKLRTHSWKRERKSLFGE